MELQGIVDAFDNGEALSDAMRVMERRLHTLTEKGIFIEPHDV